MPTILTGRVPRAHGHRVYQPGGLNGGLSTIFDHLREGGTSFSVSDWRRGDAE